MVCNKILTYSGQKHPVWHCDVAIYKAEWHVFTQVQWVKKEEMESGLICLICLFFLFVLQISKNTTEELKQCDITEWNAPMHPLGKKHFSPRVWVCRTCVTTGIHKTRSQQSSKLFQMQYTLRTTSNKIPMTYRLSKIHSKILVFEVCILDYDIMDIITLQPILCILKNLNVLF